jgi:hypothetical protein
LHAAAAEECAGSDEESIGALALNGAKSCIDLAARPGVEDLDLQPEDGGGFPQLLKQGINDRTRIDQNSNTNSLGHQLMQEF